MIFHPLKVLPTLESAKAEVPEQETAKQPAAGIKARKRAPAAA
jgi:hypothetical protein